MKNSNDFKTLSIDELKTINGGSNPFSLQVPYGVSFEAAKKQEDIAWRLWLFNSNSYLWS